MGNDDATASRHPTLDRIAAVRDESQAVGEFLEWLQSERVELLRWQEVIEDERACTAWVPDHSRENVVDELRRLQAEIEGGDPSTVKPLPRNDVHPKDCRCGGTGWIKFTREGWVHAFTGGMNSLLYRYFEIDEDQAERERRALLDEVRARNP